MNLQNKRIFVAGHNGMVGQAIARALTGENAQLLTASRSEVDLRRQADVETWFAYNKPDVVFLAAAKVGGILANSLYPADFLADNLAIQQNIILASQSSGVQKLLFLGSSCIYPRMAPQPMEESVLLTGPLEETNQWYAIAKIAGLKMVQALRQQHGLDYISCMPTNLYGPGDTYHAENSHVIPAFILKFHEAKLANKPSITLWGSGTPKREFLHVDDLAQACVMLVKKYSGDVAVNVGVGEDVSIANLARTVARVVGFEGDILWDSSKPDGTPRKLLNVSRIHQLGWRAQIPMERGLMEAYQDFLSRYNT